MLSDPHQEIPIDARRQPHTHSKCMQDFLLAPIVTLGSPVTDHARMTIETPTLTRRLEKARIDETTHSCQNGSRSSLEYEREAHERTPVPVSRQLTRRTNPLLHR